MTVASIFVAVDPVVGVVIVVEVVIRMTGVRGLPALVLLAEDGRHGQDWIQPTGSRFESDRRNADSKFRVKGRHPEITPKN